MELNHRVLEQICVQALELVDAVAVQVEVEVQDVMENYIFWVVAVLAQYAVVVVDRCNNEDATVLDELGDIQNNTGESYSECR